MTAKNRGQGTEFFQRLTMPRCRTHDEELLCPVCDRREILKIAAGLIEKRGKRGGRKAAQNMTPEQRKERAQKAAKSRWKK